MKVWSLVRAHMIAALAFTAAQAVAAQTVVIDEGGFRLMVDGKEVGTETFYIRQNGTGSNAVMIAAGKVVLDTAARGSQTMNSQLEMSGGGVRPAEI